MSVFLLFALLFLGLFYLQMHLYLMSQNATSAPHVLQVVQLHFLAVGTLVSGAVLLAVQAHAAGGQRPAACVHQPAPTGIAAWDCSQQL